MLRPTLFGYEPSAGGQLAAQMRAQADSTAGGNQAQRDVRYLEDRFERLSLVTMAMWSLIQDKTQLTEADLLARVELIDLMDGETDGKAGRVGVTKCRQCSRAMNQRHRRCIYCGAERQVGSAFDQV